MALFQVLRCDGQKLFSASRRQTVRHGSRLAVLVATDPPHRELEKYGADFGDTVWRPASHRYPAAARLVVAVGWWHSKSQLAFMFQLSQ